MNKIILYISIPFLFSACFKERKSEIAAEKMQEFVVSISDYAAGFDEDFIIIPQNGIELAFNNTDLNDGINENYLAAVDGFGVEELFYDGSYSPDGERLDLLHELKTYKKVLVSDYVNSETDADNAAEVNREAGFISFPRTSDNREYEIIPQKIYYENATDIKILADAQNYLYLISTDNFSSKQEMISSISKSSFDLIITDLFFEDTAFTSSEISQLKVKANGGQRLVIAYLNIGSAETYRYYWEKNWGLHHPLWIKRKYEGYDDEYWVKFWDSEWQKIICGNENSYTKRIINAGFDGAYLDNVEAYYFIYFRD